MNEHLYYSTLKVREVILMELLHHVGGIIVVEKTLENKIQFIHLNQLEHHKNRVMLVQHLLKGRRNNLLLHE